jgi:TrmH family RNA methyltransferase
VTGARDLLQSKNRRTRNQFLAEGPQGVEAALQAELAKSVFVTDWDSDLAALARSCGVRVNLVTAPAMDALCETVSPQGVVAVCDIPDSSLEAVLATKPRSLAVCVGVSDPGNLGTIIRTAAASGVDAVITTSGSVDAWSGKVVRATAGTFAVIPVIAGLDDAMLRTTLQNIRLHYLPQRATQLLTFMMRALLKFCRLHTPGFWEMKRMACLKHGFPMARFP